MEVYKLHDRDTFYLVYGGTVDDIFVMKISTGSLGKIGFYKYPKDKFRKFHPEGSEYKDGFDSETKQRIIQGFFWAKPDTLRNGGVWG